MAVDAGTPVGALLVLEGLEEPLRPLGEDVEPMDFNGAQAQLVENGGELGLLVVTFTGYFLQVPASACRWLPSDALEGYDLVLGPSSDPEGLAEQMPSLLLERGFVTTHVILPARGRAGILSAVKQLEDCFYRLPIEFELGYLGRGPARSDKVAMLEGLEAGSLAESSGLLAQERSVSEHLRLLKHRLQEPLGIQLSSRTNLLLRLSGAAPAAEAPRAPAPREAEAFLALMGRRRLCLLRFLGPSTGKIRLIPREADYPEVSMVACLDLQVLFLTQLYDFQFEPDGECLVLQSFLLEEPLQMVFQKAEMQPARRAARRSRRASQSQVLVKGMSSRDPCEADLHEKLWTALRHGGCDGFLEIPKTRFDVDQYIDYEDQQRAMASFKSYCRHQGHIEGIEIFDAAFFNIPDQEVRGMDPEQRIFMETGWLAMSDAGYEREKVRIESAHIGVFVGISGSDWRDVCKAPSANGVPETFIANRFSYAINLKGPSFIVNTACSASLVALHSAKTHLLMPQDPLDACLIAGISLNVSPGTWAGNCAGAMLSFRGRCFSFNNTADGYGRGEGCAAAVLGRGEYDQDDDTTCGTLAASHSNSDGRSASLTAPNGPAQQRLLRAALSEARLQPTDLDIYEAHGTGTSLGDPIEVSAVRKVLTQRETPVMISCSKTNLGHLEGGAGMSAFCKCVLACMHAEVAPNQHLRVQNPNMDTEGWPALLLQEGQALKGEASYVGVSGFGYGGTNSHAMAFGKNVVTSRGGRAKNSAGHPDCFPPASAGFQYNDSCTSAVAYKDIPECYMSCRVHGIDDIKFFNQHGQFSRACSEGDLQRLLFLASTVETGKVQGFDDTKTPSHPQADALIRQVRSAPPEIAMVGDNFEDWQSNGVPHLSMKPGQSFQVDVMEGGRTFWSAVPSSKPRSVKGLSIQGSFNGWTAESLVARETRVGLYEFELSLGASGSESFQVLVDGLTSQVLHPAEPHCTSRVAPVRGPRHDAGRELAWVIQGAQRDRFLIEVFLPPGEVQSMSVTWFKLRDIAPLPSLQTPPAPAPQPMVLDELGIEE
ncbi:ppsA [Symbiodinium sp. CCMP2592]|nr:ppsA [Symbiodinium sp. CCMP2592]